MTVKELKDVLNRHRDEDIVFVNVWIVDWAVSIPLDKDVLHIKSKTRIGFRIND